MAGVAELGQAYLPAVDQEEVRPLGQIAARYLVAQVGEEVQIVDQHTAHERLMLYRQGSGHPLPREIRARLVEIVHELDRLWDVRRHELAGPPLQLQSVIPSAAQKAPRAAAAARPARDQVA